MMRIYLLKYVPSQSTALCDKGKDKCPNVQTAAAEAAF